MDRSSSRGTLLRLPLAKHNTNGISDIDESASDGYDWPGRLVINTSKNCSVSLPARDRTEHWMKTGFDQGGDQQQLCQIDIGSNCYVVCNTFKG